MISGPSQVILHGAVLCTIGGLAAPLLSTYDVSVVRPLSVTTKMSPDITKCPERQNPSELRTTECNLRKAERAKERLENR